MSTIRKAARADLDAVCCIYDQIHTAEERGEAAIGWQRGVYPERETAEAALARGDLFVQEQNGEIVGTAILNQTQVDSYAGANWRYDAPDSEVMVLHTLVIDPEAKSRGLGREFAAFYEGYALAHGCRYLRIDTNARNARARRFYQKLGYAEIGVVPCMFNGIAGVQLVLLEKRLPPLRQITADEAPRLRACVQALSEHHNRVSVNFKGSYPSRPYDKTLSLFAQALEENVSRIAVIEEDSGIVGFCKVDLHGDGTGKLDYLVVLPQCRGRKYGKALMDWAMAVFSGSGVRKIEVKVVDGNDAVHLYEKYGCKVQLGGSDQWGNITTGTELIRRKLGAEAYAITCPLITKADGTKFGKTESGNVWLDPRYTSPYKFYQFWLNVSDDDAKRYIKIFTLLDRATIDALVAEHDAAPHLRTLQKRLAEEITVMIHSREEYEKAVEASQILFGGATSEALRRLDEQTLLQVFEGVPQFTVARAELGLPFVDLCAAATQIFPSKGECRKMVQGGGVALNKEKVADAMRPVTEADLIAGKYLLVQRGKKNYYLVTVE